jgi:hypothetical protein
MGTFTTTEGYTGYASEGFRKTGGVTAIYKGKKKKQGSTLIYKKGQEEPAPPTTPKTEYEIKSSTGEPVKVKVNPQSSYPATQAAQRFRANISTEEAQRLAQNLPPTRQRVDVAVSASDVEKFNKGMKEAGISNAGEFISALKTGQAKINQDKTFTITKEETTTETTTEATPPTEKEINKKYFGVEEYFKQLTTAGGKELEEGLKIAYASSGREGLILSTGKTSTKIVTGAAKTIYGLTGATASALIEPIAWALLAKRKYEKGVITEEEATSEIYKIIQKKEAEQTQTGALQLAFLYGAAMPSIKYSELTALHKEAITVNKEAPTYLYREPTITKEGLKTFGQTPQRAGLTAEQSGLINKEIQAQLKPTETINIYGKRGIFEYKKPVETKSIYAPKPNEQDYFTTIKQFNPEQITDLKINLEAEGQTFISPSTKLTPAKPSTITPEKTINMFRQENPTINFRTTDLTLDYPQKVLPEPHFKQETVKVSFLGNKKAQTGTIIDFDRSVYEKSPGGNIINKFKPDLISPAETSLGTSSGERLFIPVAIGTTGIISPVSKINTNTYTVSKPSTKTYSISTGKPAIKTIVSTEQIQEQDIWIKQKPKVSQRSKVIQSTEQIQEQETEQKNIFTTRTNKVFKPIEEKPKQTNTPPPSSFKRFKQPQKNNIFGTLGYNVFIRNKGIFAQANTKALSKSQAINFGANIVESTTAATFKIIPSKSQLLSNQKIPAANLKNFYTNKKGYFIEKPSKRINTFGELQGITFKGIQSKKIKKLFG